MNAPDIRRGDTWDDRDVKSVACGIVSYVRNGKLRRCSIESFWRWALGAELSFATDWNERWFPKRRRRGAWHGESTESREIPKGKKK